PESFSASDAPDPELVSMTRRFIASAVLAVPLAVIAMQSHMPFSLPAPLNDPRVAPLAQLALAAPIVVWGGAPFLARGAASLRSRNFNMFTLISLGVMAAFVYSLAVVLFPAQFAAWLGQKH